MLTREQKAYIAERREAQRVPEALQVKILSGDVYTRMSRSMVTACDPDGNVRFEKYWPEKGVTLTEMEASDRVIEEMI
jgi:hypothetical protein